MKYLFATILILASAVGSAQNLSIDQLIHLQGKSLTYVEEYLTERKWVLLRVSSKTTASGSASFAYGKNSYDDKAIAFFDCWYNPWGTTMVGLQVYSSTPYIKFLQRMEALGFKLTDTIVEDGRISKTYYGKRLLIVVSTSTEGDDFGSTRTIYEFNVHPKY
jgi:hypothetical protein